MALCPCQCWHSTSAAKDPGAWGARPAPWPLAPGAAGAAGPPPSRAGGSWLPIFSTRARQHYRQRSREHYRDRHGYQIAGARQQHVPGQGLRWASVPGWPRHLGAWGGRRAGSQDSQHRCSLSCVPRRARALAHAHARTRARAPAHLLGSRIQAAPSPHPHPHAYPPAGGTAPGRHGLHHGTSLCPPDALTHRPPA